MTMADIASCVSYVVIMRHLYNQSCYCLLKCSSTMLINQRRGISTEISFAVTKTIYPFLVRSSRSDPWMKVAQNGISWSFWHFHFELPGNRCLFSSTVFRSNRVLQRYCSSKSKERKKPIDFSISVPSLRIASSRSQSLHVQSTKTQFHLASSISFYEIVKKGGKGKGNWKTSDKTIAELLLARWTA